MPDVEAVTTGERSVDVRLTVHLPDMGSMQGYKTADKDCDSAAPQRVQEQY